MELSFEWINNNLLSIVAVGLTLILIYHYMIERETYTTKYSIKNTVVETIL